MGLSTTILAIGTHLECMLQHCAPAVISTCEVGEFHRAVVYQANGPLVVILNHQLFFYSRRQTQQPTGVYSLFGGLCRTPDDTRPC